MTTTAPARDAPTGQEEGRHRHLGLALAVISIAQLMVVLDATIVNIALPSMQRDLHFSATNLEWVINAYALAFGGLLLFGGRTGDLFGRRRMFIVGLSVFALASLAGGLATSQLWLIAARAAQGIGGAIASPTALSLVAETFPEGRSRNRAMGVYAAMSGAGGAIGLLLGGILTDVASWRWVLFVNVPIGLLTAAAVPFVLAPSRERRPGRLDAPGAITVTAGMTLLVFGLSHAPTHGWASAGTVGSLAAAAVLLAAFIVIEVRSRHPLMPLRIFANRNRSGAYAIMLALGAAVFAMFFFLTQFVQDVLGYSPLKAGVAFVPLTVVIAGMAGVTSRLVNRIGPRPPMTVGPLLAAAGLFWISFSGPGTTYGGLLPSMALIAGGMGLSFVPLTLTAVAGVRRDEQGLASALLNTGQQIGGSLGLAVLVTVSTTAARNKLTEVLAALHLPTSLASRAGAGGPPPPNAPPIVHHVFNVVVTHGYDAAFRVGSLIAVAAFVVALVAIRVTAADTPAEAGPIAA